MEFGPAKCVKNAVTAKGKFQDPKIYNFGVGYRVSDLVRSYLSIGVHKALFIGEGTP